MPSDRGRWVRMSPHRQMISELLRACQSMPSVRIERTMPLADVAAARYRLSDRPSWTAIFTKAFAIVAQETPALRRSYVRFPWPHFYEHPNSVAMMTLEREHEGENCAFFTSLRSPESQSIQAIHEHFRACKSAPLESISACRRALRLGRLPLPLCRLAMWIGINTTGAIRVKHFGTFTVTSVAALGSGASAVIVPNSCALHYGTFDVSHRIEMRFTFDHRVFDGAVAARALAHLQESLQGPILRELQNLPTTSIAA